MSTIWLSQLISFGRKYGGTVLHYARSHPRIFGSVLTSIGVSAIYSVQMVRDRHINDKIDSQLISGTRPRFRGPCVTLIDRSDVVNCIYKLLIEPDPVDETFGIITGPTGTGKTQSTIAACNVKPEWILYHEITQPMAAAKQLAVKLGIPVTPGIFHRIEAYLFPSFNSFYFPEDPVKAMEYVLQYVASRAKEVAKKVDDKVMPCLVIDGVENLAKYQPDVLQVLMRLAKYYAYRKKLRIILVYSDGNVMSLVEESFKHRFVKVVEVGDFSDEEAEKYLTRCANVPDHFAKRLVNLIGGRLLHLNFAINIYHENADCNEEVVFETIKKQFYSSVAACADDAVVDNAPISELIIKFIASKGPLFSSKLKTLIRAGKSTHCSKVQDVIQSLVNANVLRYQADGRLTWHNKFVANRYQS